MVATLSAVLENGRDVQNLVKKAIINTPVGMMVDTMVGMTADTTAGTMMDIRLLPIPMGE